MKCVIYCGGKGTRLREETEFKPKPLVEIGSRPILWHIMKIYATYGVKDFILTLGYKGDLIKRYFKEYHWVNTDFTLNLKTNEMHFENEETLQEDDWKVTCAETGIDSATGLRLFKVRKYLEEEEDFCLTYGDGVANVNITELIKYHQDHGKIITITGLHPRTKFGLLVTNNQNVTTDFIEKPILPDVINGGFMVINKKIWEYLTDENSMFENSILPKLARMNKIMIYPFNNFWHAMDTYKDFEELNELWNKGAPWKVW